MITNIYSRILLLETYSRVLLWETYSRILLLETYSRILLWETYSRILLLETYSRKYYFIRHGSEGNPTCWDPPSFTYSKCCSKINETKSTAKSSTSSAQSTAGAGVGSVSGGTPKFPDKIFTTAVEAKKVKQLFLNLFFIFR